MPGFKFDVDELNWLFEPNTLKPRSFAFICNAKTAKTWKRKKLIYEFGSRSNGDILIHFRNELIKPESSNRAIFRFEDPQVKITYVALLAYVKMSI